jgi:DNA polymerase III delta prime subunit
MEETDELIVSASVQNKLDYFYVSKKIPHIIFHGPSGTGKRTIVHRFLMKIYDNDKPKMKTNIMYVNCAHGKGIKFIREELKFFAKSNIQFNSGVIFKTIVLLNADFLTIDAQSALRRCIELFSFNTRFFIIVENKHKLLNPILSRFCEIYIPETKIVSEGNPVNLHQYTIERKYKLEEHKKQRMEALHAHIQKWKESGLLKSHTGLVEISTQLYELGYSCLDIIEWVKNFADFDEKKKTEIVLCFHKVRSEFRCEKLLLLYLFDYVVDASVSTSHADASRLTSHADASRLTSHADASRLFFL